jgi:hypothetical protein
VITTRAGGASVAPYESFNLGDHVGDEPGAVAANRKRLASELGLSVDQLVWMEQIHGRTATIVRGPQPEPLPATDAVIAVGTGLAVVVVVADCVPILLADSEAQVVAAVHAGRPGARIGVLPAALTAMVEAGAQVDRIEVLLGPAACGECYEVPAAMQADFEAHLPGSATKTRKGTPGLDLRAGLWNQLSDVGVAKIGVDPRCTIEDRTLFSYRRDAGPNRQTGRIAALTWLEPEPV